MARGGTKPLIVRVRARSRLALVRACVCETLFFFFFLHAHRYERDDRMHVRQRQRSLLRRTTGRVGCCLCRVCCAVFLAIVTHVVLCKLSSHYCARVMTGLIVAYRERFPPPREDITEYYRDELMPAAAPVPDISQAPAAFMRIMLREEARVRARYGFANASKAQDVAHRTHQWCHANHYACVVLSIRGGELYLHRNARGTSGETRDVFSVELLRRAMRNYAATDIPDVDIALDVGDGAMNYDGLPVWSYCRHVKTMQGIPVPDFTFWSFPRLHALAKGGQDFSSLMETFARISRNASMAWPLRRNALFWRGSNLRRAHLLHATEQQRLAAVGQHDVDIDVQFTNDVVMYEVMNPHPRVPLLDFCNNRYVPFSLPCVVRALTRCCQRYVAPAHGGSHIVVASQISVWLRLHSVDGPV